MGRRWFNFTLHSQWMPALATLGDAKGGRVLVAGPEWQGSVPKGVRLVRSPTRYVALLGRIQTSGSDADLRALQALQQRLRLVPQTQRSRAAPAAGRAVRAAAARRWGAPGGSGDGHGRLLQAAGAAARRGGAAGRRGRAAAASAWRASAWSRASPRV